MLDGKPAPGILADEVPGIRRVAWGLMNRIHLDWRTTPVTLGAPSNADSLDYFVDELSLVEWIRLVEGEELAAGVVESVSPFGNGFEKAYVREAWHAFTLRDRDEAELLLYGCPCGDPGCGGITVHATRFHDTVRWNFQETTSPLPLMPVFEFALVPYREAFAMVRALGAEPRRR